MKKITLSTLIIALFTSWWLFKPSPVIDTAIIGGGISGLYAAYRLSDEGSIAVFEANQHLGGRILTVEVPDTNGLKVEMGAMRFMYTQENITGLITQALDLPIQNADYLANHYFHYLNDQKIIPQDFHDNPAHIPYTLAAYEHGKNPGELFLASIEAIAPGITELDHIEDIEERLRITTVVDAKGQEKMLYQLSATQVLKTYLSPQGYDLLYNASGFKAFFDDESNAYDVFIHILQNYKVQNFYELKNGAGSLVDRLANEISAKGVAIYNNHRLTSIERVMINDEAVFALYFGDEIQYARNVILTISAKALLSLSPNSVLFSDPKVYSWLNSIYSASAQKLFFIYDEPWWHKLGFQKGRAYTDLSMQQLYYLHSNQKSAILLAAFRDTRDPLGPECTTESSVSQNIDTVTGTHAVPHCLLTAAHEQLKTLHYPVNIPLPHTAIYMDWGKLPYGGAIHLWKPGIKSWELIPKIRRPYPDLNLFIAGDNFAHSTAWVEGAINSVEMLLRSEFELQNAEWIDEGYYLGP